jgi:hypothetical protein
MWKPKTQPHYGLAYPPKPFRWRRWLKLSLLLGFAVWYFARNEFVVIEITDGSAPPVGQYMPDRRFNGHSSTPIAYIPLATGDGSHAAVVHAPIRTWRRSLRIAWDAWAGEAGPIPAPIEIRRDDWLPFRCVVVVRWTAGAPHAQACATIPAEWSRIDPNDRFSAPLW